MSEFWTVYKEGTRDPKRAYRFVLQIPGFSDGSTGGYVWWVKKVNKPSLTITEATHKYLNHTFYYPGKVEWNTVTVSLVDPVDPDAASKVSLMLSEAGYKVPTAASGQDDFSTISKAGAFAALGDVYIIQIGADGSELEKWTLKQAWIKDIKYGDLDYDGDDHTVVDVEFRYDWAVLETLTDGQKYFSTEG